MLDLDATFDFLSQIREEIDKDVLITGGEPFLHPGIYDFLDCLGSVGMTARINTNLTKYDRVELLERKGVISRIDTSVDHIDRKKHNSVRGGYDVTFKSIDWLLENGIPVGITVPLSHVNFEDTLDIFREFSIKNPEYIFFQPVDVSGYEQKKDHSLQTLDEEQLRSLFADLEVWAEETENDCAFNLMKKFYLSREIPSRPCSMKSEYFVIDVDGSVVPCFHRKDLQAGTIYQPGREVLRRLSKSQESIYVPDCFGERCIPLFPSAE